MMQNAMMKRVQQLIIPSSRRKLRSTPGIDSAAAAAIPNLSGSNQASDMQSLNNSNANDEQWTSAYQQLFDRN
jgi:hypothetical protein